MVCYMYDTSVPLTETADAWKQEVNEFIENYGFPCTTAWDDFHVYFGTKLKNHNSV